MPTTPNINPLRTRRAAGATQAEESGPRTARQAKPASGALFVGVLCFLAVTFAGLAVFSAWRQYQESAEFDAIMETFKAPAPVAVPPPPPTTMLATWYGKAYHGRRTSSGERFDRHALTAAHRTMPFGTRLQVRHGGREVEVRVTDRGPQAWTGKDLDLSEAAFARLAPLTLGVLKVEVREVLP